MQTLRSEWEAEDIALDKRRVLHGWSQTGIDTFSVALVTSGEEITRATGELTGDRPTGYVVLRVDHAHRARRLREIIESEGLISRSPTAGEREALETGLDAMGIPRTRPGGRAVTGRVVLAADDAGHQRAIGPVYTEASLERLRQEVDDYGWTVTATVPHYSRADFTSARAERLIREAGS